MTMTAYVIGAGMVSDPAGFGEYQGKVGEVIARYGGHFIAAGQADAVEGEFRPDAVAIIEFPSMEQARAWLMPPTTRISKPFDNDLPRSRSPSSMACEPNSRGTAVHGTSSSVLGG